MSQEKTIKDIQRFTSLILEDSFNQQEAINALNNIHADFQQITNITGFEQKIEYMAAIPAAKGKALGLNYAAQCLLDFNRTVKFLRAIMAAIKEKQQQKPVETIKVFYAGCGPYAPFITLIASLFKPEELQFCILEINKSSLDATKKLIEALALSNYIEDFYLADAITFKVPDANLYHILISETLDAVLYRECYVPILFNLLPQFNKDVVLIPENVCINLSLISVSEEEIIVKEQDLGAILDVREALSSCENLELLPAQLPEKSIDLKALENVDFDKMLLDTKVQVYKNIWLERNESSLTLPLQITLEKPFLNNSIVFFYQIEPEIELKCRFE